ncbi:MAG: bifunctional DNA-formamidopyrimidine glycosylase/DNA-(apurinic or apyrimidinic site) lyase [Sedimentisphaerales bacterium]|nr:bifunctional DNA-formamidopyrimidine glycosylase/DNA-(apurinic or apyrimidinic site) lyase [Sedimentisphaerales bacterium]
MPELPEVENIAAGLRREIIGRPIERIEILTPGMIRGPYRRRWRKTAAALHQTVFRGVRRRAKRLILVTDGPFALLVQLGMTGKFLLAGAGTKDQRHVRFTINFSDGGTLRYIDLRRFGSLWFLDSPELTGTGGRDSPTDCNGLVSLNDHDLDILDEWMRQVGLERLGPEANRIKTTELAGILTGSRPIKSLLLDQARIAGLGNIYADESLFDARIHPLSRACDLKPGNIKELRNSMRRVLRRAIEQGGTTFSDYRNAYGQMGRFGAMLKVYRRAGESCRRCGRAIERIRISGRSSHFCPFCQPLLTVD